MRSFKLFQHQRHHHHKPKDFSPNFIFSTIWPITTGLNTYVRKQESKECLDLDSFFQIIIFFGLGCGVSDDDLNTL